MLDKILEEALHNIEIAAAWATNVKIYCQTFMGFHHIN